MNTQISNNNQQLKNILELLDTSNSSKELEALLNEQSSLLEKLQRVLENKNLNNMIELEEQKGLIEQIQNAIVNAQIVQPKVELCDVIITNNCGIAAGGPQPMVIYSTYENNKIAHNIIKYEALLQSPTIQVIKDTFIVIKDANFLGIAPSMQGQYEYVYHDGQFTYIYNISGDCKITIEC